MLSAISCSNLSYIFPDGTALFSHLNFSIGFEKMGLVGPNGIGKTTLLKLIQGKLAPTEGTIQCHGSLQVLDQRGPGSGDETLDCWLGIAEVLAALDAVEAGTAMEDSFEKIDGQWDLRERLREIRQKLGIEHLALSRPLNSLSGGEAVKVRLARILLGAPEIVILDEPTNNLDAEGRAVLYEFMDHWDKCLLVVSHDRELLSRVDSILELTNRGLAEYGGNFDFYDEQREIEAKSLEQRVTTAGQKLRKQKRELQQSHERQEKRMHRGQKEANKGGIPKIIAGGLKRQAERTMARAKGLHEDRLSQAQSELGSVRALIKERNKIKIDIPETRVPNGKVLFEITDFNFRFSKTSEYLWARPVTYVLTGPRRVVISGDNGTGKTTLIRFLTGKLSAGTPGPIAAGTPDGQAADRETIGTITLKTDRFSYLDQYVALLDDRLTLLENFSRATPHLTESERRIRLGRFLFDRGAVEHRAETLSGGERIRAGLVCVLFAEHPPQLLILDEPTNNLDLDSIERVESALSSYQGALLVVSHDQTFLKNIGIEEQIELRKSRSI